MQTHLVTYCNQYYVLQQQRLIASAHKHGIDCVHAFGEQNLKTTAFYRENQAILDSPRGAGFFAWKPYFIYKTLIQLAPTDFLLYADSGIEIVHDVTPLADIASHEKGVVLFSNNGYINRQWTKRDCFVAMDCDAAMYWDAGQVNGAFQLYRNTEFSRRFLEDWLKYSCVPEAITDSSNRLGKSNFSDFKDHRHDQSILSILAVKHDVTIYRDPSQWGNYSKIPKFRVSGEWLSVPYQDSGLDNSPYGTLFNHHRDRGFRLRLKGKWRNLKARIASILRSRGTRSH